VEGRLGGWRRTTRRLLPGVEPDHDRLTRCRLKHHDSRWSLASASQTSKVSTTRISSGVSSPQSFVGW